MKHLHGVMHFSLDGIPNTAGKSGSRPSLLSWGKSGRIFVVSLAGGNRKVLVKDITQNTHIKDPVELLKVHAHVVAQDEVLVRSMPKIYLADPTPGCIMMEYIEAPTLEKVLGDDLAGRRDQEQRIGEFLANLASLLLALHGVRLVSRYPSFHAWRNDEVLSKFEPIFTDPAIRRYLPKGMDTLESFYARFSPGFFSRTYEELALVDCQPKNILAPASGPLRFIDLDYTVNNPALGVAQFLISLDRLGLRCPIPSRMAKINAWQHRFVLEYLRGANPTFAESLAFFYPSTLLRTYSLHARKRRALRSYLRWYYGSRLRRFLEGLQEIPADQYPHGVPELFASR
jgi:hypothetical protein